MLVYNRSLYCICVILKYVNLLMSMTDYHLCYYLDNSVRGKLSFYNRKPTSCSWEIVKLILETLSSLVWNLYKKVLEVFLMPYKLQVIFVLHYIYSYIFLIITMRWFSDSKDEVKLAHENSQTTSSNNVSLKLIKYYQ